MAKINFGGVEEEVVTQESFRWRRRVKSSRTKSWLCLGTACRDGPGFEYPR